MITLGFEPTNLFQILFLTIKLSVIEKALIMVESSWSSTALVVIKNSTIFTVRFDLADQRTIQWRWHSFIQDGRSSRLKWIQVTALSSLNKLRGK